MTPEPPITDPNIVIKKSTVLIEISDIIAGSERTPQLGAEYNAIKLRYEM